MAIQKIRVWFWITSSSATPRNDGTDSETSSGRLKIVMYSRIRHPELVSGSIIYDFRKILSQTKTTPFHSLFFSFFRLTILIQNDKSYENYFIKDINIA